MLSKARNLNPKPSVQMESQKRQTKKTKQKTAHIGESLPTPINTSHPRLPKTQREH